MEVDPTLDSLLFRSGHREFHTKGPEDKVLRPPLRVLRHKIGQESNLLTTRPGVTETPSLILLVYSYSPVYPLVQSGEVENTRLTPTVSEWSGVPREKSHSETGTRDINRTE